MAVKIVVKDIFKHQNQEERNLKVQEIIKKILKQGDGYDKPTH